MQQENSRASSPASELKAIFVGFILVVLVIVYFAARPNEEKSAEEILLSEEDASETASALPTIPVSEAITRLADKSARFIDIRSSADFEASHVPGSESIDPNRLANLVSSDTGAPTVVVWTVSEREGAELAHGILGEKLGDFRFLEGGFEGWISEGGIIVSKGDSGLFSDQSKVTLFPAAEFRKYVDEALVLSYILDVRTKQQFESGHIPKAVNIPLSELEYRYREIPPATNIVVYGSNATETFQAAVRLFDLGSYSVRSLAGGFPDWSAAGYPVE